MSIKVGTYIPYDSPDFQIKGSGLICHFWSISCPACKSNMAYLQELRDKYAIFGLQTIAIHMPRSEAELVEEKVWDVAKTIHVTEPLILDNEHKIVEAFEVNAVPAYFLFDSDGKLRRHAIGNFGVRIIGQAIQRLLGEMPEGAKDLGV